MRRFAGWFPTGLCAALAAALVLPTRAFAETGLPVIDTPPASQSVASGATATFNVAAHGLAPLSYQWRFNGTNLAGAVDSTLIIPNVQMQHWGGYSVVVTNTLGATTSTVATLVVDANLVFHILSLQTNGAVAVEHASLTGLDRGGIAASDSIVLVTGDANNGAGQTARFSIDNLTGGTPVGAGFDALTANLRTETIYNLGSGGAPISYDTFNGILSANAVTSLLQVDGVTGQLTGQQISLSTSVPISYSSGIFAGYDRVVIFNNNNQRVYNIALPSGTVTDLGTLSFPTHRSSESWAFWGVAEYFGGSIHLMFTQSIFLDGISGTAIARIRLADRTTSVLLGPISSPGLGDMSSFTFSISRSRWFFHIDGSSIFRSPGDETVGSAKASFTTDADYPAILAEPAEQVSYPTSNVTFRVTATGIEPLHYQWLFNGKAIAGETKPVLTLIGIDTNSMGLYAVEVSNPLGNLISRQALLTVYSSPQMVSQPQSRSVFPGTNTLFTVFVNAAPPLTYQWRFNGTSVGGATNSSLLLTNIQPSQDGFYSVTVSNRFGGLISTDAELNVVVPFDDGSVFQVTSLTTNNIRITDAYNNLGFAYAYGPLAVSTSRVFYASTARTARNNLDDLSGATSNTPPLTAIVSNLRTETVYALGNHIGPFTNYQSGLLTNLWEVNGTSGALTGNRIPLSTPINLPSQSSQVGFFAGYERVVVLANSRAYNIALPSGFVTDLGPMQVPSHAFSLSGAFWGIAEHSQGVTYLVYPRSDEQNIARTRVPDGVTTNFVRIPGLSFYMSSITASITRGRWYFSYLLGSQAFGGVNATVGSASATFTNNPGFKPARLDWSPIGEAQLLNAPIPVTITARTANNEVATNYNNPVTLSGLSGTPPLPITIAPTSVAGFVNGVWTGHVTVSQASTSMVLRAVDFLGVAGTSSVFSVNVPDDLLLMVKDSPDPVGAGQRLTYTLTAYNTGPNPATGVNLTNTLSDGVTFVSASSSQGSCTQTDRIIQCGIGTVNQGTPATITISVDAGAPGTATNRATLIRGEADPTAANNSVVTLTTVTPPLLSINDVTLVEGNSGTNDMVFTVRLFPPAPNQVTVSFTTLNGTATGGGSSADYVPVSGLLTFPPGATNQIIRVGIRGDVLYELTETFSVSLNSPVNAFFEDSLATGTIPNDDPIPSVSVANVSVTEGNSGFTNAIFQVHLSTNAGVAVSVAFSTVNGTAREGSDFTGTNGIVTFPAGSLQLTRSVPVAIRGDTNVEPDESFQFLFSVTNATALNTQAVCTIIADDGLGVLHHFSWSPISSPQQLDTPIPVTVTAEDAFNSPIANFTSAVAFSGRVAPPSTTVLSDSAFTNSGTGDFTIGYSFVPKSDLTVTHFRHYSGTKVSLWDEAGQLLASSPVSSNDGTWQETALATPVALTPGATYLIAAYTGNGSYYYRDDPTTNFTDVNLVAGRYAIGDSLPDQNTGLVGWAVDIRYVATSLAQSVAVTPASSGIFLNGVWTGEISVQAAMTNVVLEATDANQHRGTSTPFDVLVTLGADVAIDLAESPNPVSVGSNLTYTITVTNHGPKTASEVVVTDSLPGALSFLSVATTTGFATNIGNLVAVNIGTLTNHANAIISLVVRPNNTGNFTNLVVVTSSVLDLTPSNNQASRATFVYRDTDHDGIWDSWEAAYGLNLNDATDAALDPDGDRHSSWQEFIAGTNPTNATSVTRLLNIELTANGPRLTLQGVPGRRYQLERMDGPTGAWMPVSIFQINGAAGGSIVGTVTDSMPAISEVRLYRVLILP